VAGLCKDVGDEQRDGVVSAGRALTVVSAAGVGCDVPADQGQHGGERDAVWIEAGGSGGAGGERGGYVVHDQQRPGFLPHEGDRASARDTAGALDGLLQVQVRDLNRPPLMPVKRRLSLAFGLGPGRY
jgi:hypothetical protein